MAELLRVFVPDRPSWRLHELTESLGPDKATTLCYRGKLVEMARTTGVAHAEAELTEGLEAYAVPIPSSIFGAAAALGCAGPTAMVRAGRDVVEAALLEAAEDLRPRGHAGTVDADVHEEGRSDAAR